MQALLDVAEFEGGRTLRSQFGAKPVMLVLIIVLYVVGLGICTIIIRCLTAGRSHHNCHRTHVVIYITTHPIYSRYGSSGYYGVQTRTSFGRVLQILTFIFVFIYLHNYYLCLRQGPTSDVAKLVPTAVSFIMRRCRFDEDEFHCLVRGASLYRMTV